MQEKGKTEQFLKALANTRRLSVVTFLKARKTANVGDIAEEIKLSFRSTSRHLQVLLRVEVLEREQHGTTVYYRLAKNYGNLLREAFKNL